MSSHFSLVLNILCHRVVFVVYYYCVCPAVVGVLLACVWSFDGQTTSILLRMSNRLESPKCVSSHFWSLRHNLCHCSVIYRLLSQSVSSCRGLFCLHGSSRLSVRLSLYMLNSRIVFDHVSGTYNFFFCLLVIWLVSHSIIIFFLSVG